MAGAKVWVIPFMSDQLLRKRKSAQLRNIKVKKEEKTLDSSFITFILFNQTAFYGLSRRPSSVSHSEVRLFGLFVKFLSCSVFLTTLSS